SLHPGILQFEPNADRQEATNHAGNQREHQVHRPNVLMVGRIYKAPPSGRMVLVDFMCNVRIVCAARSRRIASHRYCPSNSSLSPAYSSVGSAGRSHCGRTAVIGCKLLFRLFKPRGVLLVVHHANHDRHVGMILAAKLGALAVVDAFALGLEPGFVDATWYRINLDAE